MPRKPNTLLRIAVPAVLLLLGVVVAVSVAINTSRNTASELIAVAPVDAPETDFPEADTPEAVTQPADEPPAQTIANDPEPPASPASPVTTPDPVTQTPAAGPSTGDNLRFRVFADAPDPAPLGSLDAEGPDAMQVEFSTRGAGIRSLKLANQFKTVGSDEHVELQAIQGVDRNGDGVNDVNAIPFAMLAVRVGDQSLSAAGAGIWNPIAGQTGSFEAFVEDPAGNAVLRIERRFVLEPGTYEINVRQRLENLSDQPVRARLIQAGPIDLPIPSSKYGGDKRRLRFGYLLDTPRQGGSLAVTADNELRGRNKILGKSFKDAQGIKRFPEDNTIWPTPAGATEGHRLVWVALTDRYFAVAVHPLLDPAGVVPGSVVALEDKLFTGVEKIDRLILNPYAPNADNAIILTRITTPQINIPAGGSADASFGVFAGPMLAEILKEDPVATSLNLGGLIVYNFGGMCGSTCTIEWLTLLLFWILNVYHGFTFDWAVAIILLVFTVRSCLHPITRWSQVRMQRFGVQMQSMGPKMQKVREKFKDDPKRLQEETAKLWREEGVNPAGMLGCLPMFLQSPVWIALYATLFFAGEMRHEPAFYGFFQNISGGNWKFLADLASPDAAIPLPKAMQFTPPIIGGLYGKVTSINVLPLLLGVVFYLQQKYLTPPPSANMTADQEQMQKTMKVMTVVMFPIFMYTAPSGLALYFITNSTLGIVESRWIREHAKKTGMLDPDKIKAERAAKKASGGNGFFSRMRAMAEQQQQLRAQQQGGGGAGKRRVQNTAPPPPNRYKKRK